MRTRSILRIATLTCLGTCALSAFFSFYCLWQIPPGNLFRHFGLPLILAAVAFLTMLGELAVAILFTLRRPTKLGLLVAWISVLLVPAASLAAGLLASNWIIWLHGLVPET